MAARPADNPYTRRVRRLARLRQMLAVALLVAAVAVFGVYLFSRWSQRRSLAAHPAPAIARLGLQVRQSATGVVISKSKNGRPAFRVYADHADQLRANGWDELYDVRILVYDQDGRHADEISGSKFGYDEATGDLRADGLVHMDLHQRPEGAGAGASDADANPIHIDARALTFNVKTGTGRIDQPLSFSFRNASGTAGRAVIDSHAGTVSLTGGVQATVEQPGQPEVRIASEQALLQHSSAPAAGHADLNADGAVLTLLQHAVLVSGVRQLSAETMVFDLRRDQSLRHLDASGDVRASELADGRALEVSAGSAQADFLATAAHRTVISGLALQGQVTMAETLPRQQDRLNAAEAEFHFDAGHQLSLVQARGTVGQPAHLDMRGASAGAGAVPPGQASEQQVSAPEMDFHFVPAVVSTAAATSAAVPGASVRMVAADAVGGAQIELSGTSAALPVPGASTNSGARSDPVHAQAAQVHLDLDARQQPRRAIATGDVRVRQTVAGDERDSRSDRLVLDFTAAPTPAGTGGGVQVEVATETGRVQLEQGGRQILADQMIYSVPLRRAVFTAQPASAYTQGQVQGQDPDTRFFAPHLVWTSQADGSSLVTAEGGVSVSRVGADEAAGAGTAPVVITAQRLRWTQPPKSATPARKPAAAVAGGLNASFPGTAVFDGRVRMAQSPNLLRADQLTLEGAGGTLGANGHVIADFVRAGGAPAASSARSATTALALPVRSGPTPVSISASRLFYSQADNQARFEDHVVLRTEGAELTAPSLQVWMAPATNSDGSHAGGPAGLGSGPQNALASGGVRIVEPGRTASSSQARFDFGQNLATLLGGPPSIFDAEQGQISGDPLTFSLVSDEIQVGSKTGVRASGQTTVRNPSRP